MAKEELDAFFDALRGEKSLSAEFAKAVADVARNNGYDVDEQDVLERFAAEEPGSRPLPGHGHVSTMAVGEEEPMATTLAVGEEDEPAIDDDFGGGFGGATTEAVGEEGRPSVTLAIGEEDKPKRPPGGGVTSAALGEESKRRDPPAHPITTMAMGEETRKRGPLR